MVTCKSILSSTTILNLISVQIEYPYVKVSISTIKSTHVSNIVKILKPHYLLKRTYMSLSKKSFFKLYVDHVSFRITEKVCTQK